MDKRILMLLFAVLFILIAGAFAIVAFREMKRKSSGGPPPEDFWVQQGITRGVGIGIAIGVAIGSALDNIAIGIAIGVSLGAALGPTIGKSMEQEHGGEVRPLTEGEKKNERIARTFAVVVALIGLAVVAGTVVLVMKR